MIVHRLRSLPFLLLLLSSSMLVVPAAQAQVALSSADEAGAPSVGPTVAPQESSTAAAESAVDASQSADPTSQEGEDVVLVRVPTPDLEGLDEAVRLAITYRQEVLQAAMANPQRAELSEAFGELGLLYQAHELLQAAMACYSNAHALSPEDPRWPYVAALASRGLGELEQAGKLYLQSLDLFERNTAALIGLAEVRLEQNQTELARAYLKLALEFLPESPSVLAVLGQVELSDERYDRAIDYLQRALAQRDDANRLHYPLALAYRGLGDLEKARHHLELRGDVGVRPPDMMRDAIEARKTGERVMLLEGRRAFNVGRYAEAANFFAKALEMAPESIGARVNLASALGLSGQQQAALEQFTVVLEADPENASAHFNLGVLLLQEEKAAEALSHFERSVASDDQDAEAWAQLAQTRRQLERTEGALEAYDRAAKLDPQNSALILDYAGFLRQKGREAAARDLLIEAYRLRNDNGDIAHELARLFASSSDLSLRDGEKALVLAEVVAKAQGSLIHFETLALALAEVGRCEDAAGLLSQIVESLPAETPPRQRAILQSNLHLFQNGPPCRPPR